MKGIWIIRRPGPEPVKGRLAPEADPGSGTQVFEVSALGRAVMLHLPHSIRAPLVGFETVPKKRPAGGGSGGFFRWRRKERPDAGGLRLHEAHLFQDLDFSEYPDLSEYIRAFRAALLRNSPVLAELARLDLEALERLNGLYAAPDGSVRSLSLSGGPVEQKIYIEENYGRPVEILMDPGGTYDSNLSLRLDPRLFRAFLSGPAYRVECRVEGGIRREASLYDGRRRILRTEHGEIIDRLFLLQHAVELEPSLGRALSDCLSGTAVPHRLTIKRFHVGQSLSEVAAPLSLEKEFERLSIGPLDRKRILRELRGQVVLCIFSYSPGLVDNDARIHDVGVVLHHLDGIRSIEQDYPELARSLRARATNSEVGTYYLFSGFRSSTPAAAARPAAAGEDGKGKGEGG